MELSFELSWLNLLIIHCVASGVLLIGGLTGLALSKKETLFAISAGVTIFSIISAFMIIPHAFTYVEHNCHPVKLKEIDKKDNFIIKPSVGKSLFSRPLL